MASPPGAPDQGPCPHCGQTHPEDELVCPNTDKQMPLEGRVLDNKFRLRRKLGQGGMSTVWQAENVLVRKWVAIKLMHPEFARNPTTIARFRNEATSAGRIGSAHICDILDFGRSVLGPYIVMEMLRGQDLGHFVEKRGALEPGMAVHVVRQALDGLASAHEANIIHRDLKPDNVFLHQPGEGKLVVKLMDFGISKFTEDVGDGKTGAGVLMGTPEYMSPEQAQGARDVDNRTDVWAMGVILYFCLTAKEPFRGPTLASVLMALSSQPHRPITEYRGDVPPGLLAVIDRCMEKDPDRRFASARELSDALAPFDEKETDWGATIVVPLVAPEAALGPSASLSSKLQASDSMTVAEAVPATPTHGGGPGGSVHTVIDGQGSGPSDGLRTIGEPRGGGTWSTELAAGPGGGGGAGMTLGASEGHRPESLSGGGAAGWMLTFLILLLGSGGAVWWYMAHQPGEGGDDGSEETAVAGAEESGAPGTESGTDGTDTTGTDGTDTTGTDGTDTTGTDGAETGGTGETGGSESGTTTGAAAETSGASAETTGGDESTTGDDESTTGGDESTTGGDESTTGGSGGSGGGTGGGSSTVRPDMSLVVKSGSLYAHKRAGPKGTYSSAKGYCSKLKSQKYARLRKWRLPKASEVKRFSGKVSKTRYWTRSSSGSKATTVNLFNGSESDVAQSTSSVRVLCVSSNKK